MGNAVSADFESPDAWWTQGQQEQTQQIQYSQQSSSSSTEIILNNIDISKNIENGECDILPSIENIICATTSVEINTDPSVHRKTNEENMEQFRSDLANKHLARRLAIAERSREILFLREELAKQKKDNEDLRELLNNKTLSEQTGQKTKSSEIPGVSTSDTSWEESDQFKLLTEENNELKNNVLQNQTDMKRYEEILQQNHELRVNIAETQKELQIVNSQVIAFEKERLDYQNHVTAMKEVVKVAKQMLEIRENQLQELRTKIAEIESNLAEQETSMLSTNLRNEYEKQLRNMRALRTLYEQRQAATKAEKDSIAAQLQEVTKKAEDEQTKNRELQERIEELEKDASDKYDSIQSLQSQLGFVQAESRGLQAEMLVINQLFSQILLGFNNGQLDLDKLIKLLEENHDLLTDIVINEESMEHSSALPKMLLDLVNQVREENVEESNINTDDENLENLSAELTMENTPIESTSSEQQTCNQMSSAAEIVNNLPKVWRVLAELLSQQSGLQPVAINDDGMDPCYKSIETPKGPKLVLSVSQTFIRLKDLILEKKSLEKETTRLKHLNTHLEVRLQDQEKRLETVSTELSKTWHVVGRMQRQHQQLHTHEKILRYELAQKRKMLTELKQELEYCREKWEQAREKNSTTEEQWKKLRTEFASRKAAVTVDELNNSAESGYSDERECSSDDEASYNLNKKSNNKTTDEIVSKTPLAAEEIDETSHGSDADDILETAFNNACAINNLQSQIKMSEIVNNENQETNEASSSSSNNSDSNLNQNGDNEAVNINTVGELSSSDCDNKTHTELTDDSTIECASTDNMLHSNTRIKTDIEVQIGNDSPTQVQTDILSTHISNNEENNSLLASQNQVPVIENIQSPVTLFTESEIPSTSQTQQSESTQRSSEEILTKREERLRRLEEQCKQLVTKVTNTNNRGTEICTRLETLHVQYGNTTNPTQPENRTENEPDSDE